MLRRVIVSVFAGIAMLCAASPAFAQATRTWVSGVGDDVNPCSRTAPCKTFAGAISKTATGGEINVIDPGGFGTINITKSITIDGLGPMSSILASNTNGVIINGAGIVVTLRNLTINGANTTTGNGVRILNAAAVNIDNVVIENFGGSGTQGRGVSIETSVAGVAVTIQNSRFFNNIAEAIISAPTAGAVSLIVDNTQIAKGDDAGIRLISRTAAMINNTSVTGEAAGIVLEQTTTSANVSNSIVANNGYGLYVGLGGAPTMRLFGTAITGSTAAGLTVNGGSILSHGNNAISGNAGNEATSGSIGLQ